MVDTFFGVHLDTFKPGPIVTVVSADAFLEQTDIPRNSCVVSDVRMPGKSGLALPGLLAAEFRTSSDYA